MKARCAGGYTVRLKFKQEMKQRKDYRQGFDGRKMDVARSWGV